jgi:hypothetical protein
MRPIDYFDRGAAAFPEKVFVEGNGQQFSFADAKQSTEDIARGLIRQMIRALWYASLVPIEWAALGCR